MSNPRTIYKVTGSRGLVTYTESVEAAEGYSSCGFTVTATTGTRQ